MISSLFSRLAALFFPVAHATNIETLGTSAPGIAAMWTVIKSVFPHTNKGPNGVLFLSIKVADFILKTIGALAVVMIIYAGITMIWGGEEKLAESKKIVLYAVLGLIAALCADAAVLFAKQVVLAASA